MLSKKDYSALARSYNPLHHEHILRGVLESFFDSKSFDHLTKRELHLFFNSTILKGYKGEEYYKFQLANYYRRQKVIAGFEIRVGNSRSDFLLINGSTHNFEIKSKLDDLKRLDSQMLNYTNVFDYNYVVIDVVHLDKIIRRIPENIGIWTFAGNTKKVIRTATKNNNLNPVAQLGLLTRKDLIAEFGTVDKTLILDTNSHNQINQSFRKLLKRKYEYRWAFICRNWNAILPLDIQFFFNSNVNPSLIY